MMHFSKKMNTANPRGFTLVEMLVSVALFSVVMVIVATAYLNLLNLDRQAKATNDVSANLNFVMDTMARSIRTGTQYDCENATLSPDCPPSAGGFTLNFLQDDGVTYTTYDLVAGRIEECQSTTPGCLPDTPITDSRINVTKLTFYVTGVDNNHNSDSTEPKVTFVIQGNINVDPSRAPVTFDIETSATQRQIDI